MIHYEFNNTSLYDAGRWEVPVEEITGTAETKSVHYRKQKVSHLPGHFSRCLFFSSAKAWPSTKCTCTSKQSSERPKTPNTSDKKQTGNLSVISCMCA